MINKINITTNKQKFIVYVVLAIVTLSVFWQVNQYDFVNIDDDLYVTENSHIQSGMTLEGFFWALKETGILYHPLVWLSLMFDYELYGLNAGGYHLTNLVLHILSTLLLFWLFKRMTLSVWKSAFVAGLFALHPLHVESVAWITERKDVLSAFFWMLTLCLYVYYTEKPIIRRYLPVLCSFVLALMSKPMVVTLPVIMILLDYWPLKRFETRRDNIILWQLKEKTLFFILSAALSIVMLYNPVKVDVKYPAFTSRITNAPVAFVSYIEKTFWPYDLAIFYPFSEQIQLWQLWGSILLIIFISSAAILLAKRMPHLFVGWFWFTTTIAPVIGIIQIAESPEAMADRYHYLSSIGIAVMLAWGIPFLIKNKQIRKMMLFPAGIIFLTIIAFLSWQQCGHWKNSIKLWNHALQVTKFNFMAHYGRALAYAKLGKPQLSIEDWNEVIQLRPDCVGAYYHRGIAYGNLKQYQQAINNFNEVINMKPDNAVAYFYRGSAYFIQGNIKFACRDAQKACTWGDCRALESPKGKKYCN